MMGWENAWLGCFYQRVRRSLFTLSSLLLSSPTQVVSRNYVAMPDKSLSSHHPGHVPAQPYVSLAACTSSGTGLITVDIRPDAGARL